MNDYSPKVTVSHYIVRSHCPSLIGRVLGAFGVPGFQAHTVAIATSEEGATVNVRDWSGRWSSITLGPIEPSQAALDRLAREFM